MENHYVPIWALKDHYRGNSGSSVLYHVVTILCARTMSVQRKNPNRWTRIKFKSLKPCFSWAATKRVYQPVQSSVVRGKITYPEMPWVEFWIFKVGCKPPNPPICPYHYLGSGQDKMISSWVQPHSVTKIPSTEVYDLREGEGYIVRDLFELIFWGDCSNTQHYYMPVDSREHGKSIKYFGH